MDYWRGYVDWELSYHWNCWACGNKSLEWGMIHAECRCTVCGVHYFMRDENGQRVTVPISMTKDEYVEPFKLIWAKYHRHIDEVPDSLWDEYMTKEAS